MKKQINPTIKAHLIRGAFYLLLLLAVCAIPFALAQSRSRGTAKPGVANPASNPNVIGKFAAAPPSTGAANPRNLPGTSQIPQRTSRGLGAHVIPMLRPPKAPQVILYDQYDNLGSNATLSATFTDFTTFGADLADDFVVPAGQTWNVESIDADGTYFNCPNGVCPGATDWNVFIYADNAGLPGAQVYSTTNIPITVVGTTFTANLVPAAVLSAGTYWIEIQANMTFATEGEWGWTDRTVQSNSPAAWQNPGGGFAICQTWGYRGDPAGCDIDPGVPDQVYRINGTIGGGSPTPTPTASPSCTPIVITGSVDNTDPTQTDKLAQSGIPQTCPASTTCALFGDPDQFNYVDFTFTNTTNATQCVTIDTNTLCNINHSIFTAAYLGSFDPTNICNNWIGDSGFSPTPTMDSTFQVDIPAGATFVVVVSEVHHAACNLFTLTITGLCGGATPTPTPTATPTASPTCTPSGGTIYNIAGFALGIQTTTTRIYDIATDTWTTGAPIPEANGLSDQATGLSDGKIYIAGGFNGSGAISTLHIYDIASDSWTTGASMPQALFLPGFGVINGKLYIASGNDGVVELNTLYIYDIASDTWSTGAPVPTAVTGPGSAVFQGKLYLFGGGFPSPLTITQIYDPGTDTWTTGPSLNFARLWFYGGAIDDSSIVAPGGDNPPGIPLNVNEQFTSSWAVKATLPYNARGPFAVSDGTFVYIGGGFDGSTVHTDTLRFDPVANTYTTLAPAPDPHYLSQAVIVPGVPCATPTATPTATATVTVSATPTATATATVTVSATPTATATATVTASATPTATATATSTATATATPTPTGTVRPTPTPRAQPTPRPAPTQAPRPTIKPISPWPPSPTP